MNTPVSNSFDYTPAKVLDGFVLDPADCTATSLGLSESRTSRVVLVQRDRRFLLCRTATGSFDDAEIRRVVHDLGQLYLDVSGKPAIDDFADDVRQLVITGECRECPLFDGCVTCYRDAVGSFFLEDEAWLRKELAGLNGRVLDVGMGQVPYLGSIRDEVQDGALEYHGLDPEPGVLEAAGRMGLPLRLHEGLVEDLPENEGPFDHVIALRSLNHFEDVDRALARICTVLKDGGGLLVVESVALPMVRSREHSATSHEASAGGFQHYRNWDSERVLERIRGRLPLDVVFHRPIGPDTCDQWILKLVKA